VALAIVSVAFWGYAALAVTAIYWRVRRFHRELRDRMEEEAQRAADHRHDIGEGVRAAHYYLRELDEKLGSSLPRDVKVGSIQAENLVVRPGPPVDRGRDLGR
jgi:hypothetical protein